MTHRDDPMETLSRLRPRTDRSALAPGDDPLADVLLARTLERFAQGPGTTRRRWFRRRRLIVSSFVVAVVGAGAPLTWALTRNERPSDPTTVSCFREADVFGSQSVVPRDAGDPVETCRRARDIDDPFWGPMPPSVACITPTGLTAVFPGDETTCGRLDLATFDGTLSDDDLKAIRFADEVPEKLLARGCLPPDEVVRFVLDQFDALKMSGWTARSEGTYTATERCGAIAIDVPDKTVLVLPILDMWTPTAGSAVNSMPDEAASMTEPPASSVETALIAPFERLLIDSPDWQITDVIDAGDTGGEMTFRNGNSRVTLAWYPPAEYDDAVAGVITGAFETTSDKLLGQAATVFFDPSNPTSRRVVTDSSDRIAIDVRGDLLTEAEFLMVFDSLRPVSTADWLQALPGQVVRPDQRERVLEQMLAPIPLPDEFTLDQGDPTEATSRYMLGALATRQVACGWLDAYIAADSDGREAARATAAEALATSHQWPILIEMAAEGGWPEAIWSYADAANGLTPSDAITKQITTDTANAELGCSIAG